MVLCRCSKDNVKEHLSTPPPAQTITAHPKTIVQSIIRKTLKEIDYPLNKTQSNHIALAYIPNDRDDDEADGAKIDLMVDNHIYRLPDDITYNEENIYAIKPTFTIVKGTDGQSYITVFVGYTSLGRSDRYYKVHIFTYKDNQIIEVWNDNELLLESKSGSIYSTFSNHTIELNIPQYHLFEKIQFDNNKPQDFLDYSKVIQLIVSDPQDAEKLLTDNQEFSTDGIERFGIMDYDDDGNEEIFMSQDILYDPTASYLSSLYLLAELNDDSLIIKKAFIALKNTIEGQLLDQLILHGKIDKSNLNDTLTYWIKNGDIQTDDVDNVILRMLSNHIIIEKNNSYLIR